MSVRTSEKHCDAVRKVSRAHLQDFWVSRNSLFFYTLESYSLSISIYHIIGVDFSSI